MFNELSRSAIGFAQEQDEYAAKREARQAWVTRSEGNGVWVRFGGENATALESWFPSTHAGLPAGFMGWVYPIGGGKGFFVASGVTAAPTKVSTADFGNQTLSTSGTYLGTTPEAFTGLGVGRSYRIDWTTSIRYFSGDTGSHRLSCQFVGATTEIKASGNVYQSPRASGSNLHVATSFMMPDENGVITFTPAIVWVSGTVIFSRASTTATIS